MLITLTLIAQAAATVDFASADTTPQQQTNSSWTTLAAMPTPRAGFALAVVGGKIYAIGGVNSNNQALNVVEEYNPAINEWTSKRSMPTSRSGLAAAVYNQKIYVFGGTVGGAFLGNNEVYDPVTNTWTTAASMPTPRADLCASVVNGEIYLMGGKKYAGSDPFYTETNVNEAYNPDNDSWSTKAHLTTGVQGAASAVVASKIYVLGGSKQSSSPGTTSMLNSNQVYDAELDQWTSASPLMFMASYGAASATTGYSAKQSVYYFGGFSGETFRQAAQIFNFTSNSWKSIEQMPTVRGYMSVANLDDKLYVIGGFDGANYLAVNERYVPLDYGTVPPQIQVTSPQNRTYRDVSLGFSVNKGAQWIGYSLDDKMNVTVSSTTDLLGLSQGSHRIVMYANDSAGNMGTSNTVYFAVDSIAPRIVIVSPQNQTYSQNDVQLTFIVNEDTSALEYSLDGQQNVAIIGNVTLVALSNGPHKLTVFAADDLGNVDQFSVSFEVAPFPSLLLIAAVVVAVIFIALAYIFFRLRKTKKPTAPKPRAPPKMQAAKTST